MQSHEPPSGPPGTPWPRPGAGAERGPRPELQRALPERAHFLHRLQQATPRPLASFALIALNVAVFALMLARGVDLMSPEGLDLIAWGANYGPLNVQGEHWRLFTSMFLHFGLLHLGFNMWVLKSVGPFLERMLGHASFLALYLVSGLVASVAAVWWNPSAVSAGASGAIFGVVGGLIGAIAARPPELPAPFARALAKSLATFVLMNLVLGLAVPQIGLAAHLGGLVAGAAAGYALAKGGLSIGRPRRGRTLALLLAGLALTAAGAQLPPRAYPAHRAARDGLLTALESAGRRYNGALERWKAGEITQEDFAAVLENELLPPWRRAGARLDALGGGPPEAAAELDRLRALAAHQARSWELLARSLREDDAELARESARERELAERLLAEIAGERSE